MRAAAEAPTARSDPGLAEREGGRGPVLVTGAAGWLGGEIVRQLRAAGWAVMRTDRHAPADDKAEAVRVGDLRDPEFCRRVAGDVPAVVHCAARQYDTRMSPRARRRVFGENAAMAEALCTALRTGPLAQIVAVSSDMVYGVPARAPVREDDPTRPAGPYGRSKLAVEAALGALVGADRIVTVLRPRVIVGPGRAGVLRRLFAAVRAGRTVPVLGRGENRFQMVSVRDVARAAVRALERRTPGCFNLGSARPRTVNDLLGGLIARAGSRARLLHVPVWLARPALYGCDRLGLSPLAPEQFRIADSDYVVDIGRARAVLGWEPVDDDGEMLWQAYAAWRAGDGAE